LAPFRLKSEQWYLFYNAEDDFQEVARCVNQGQYVFDEELFTIFNESTPIPTAVGTPQKHKIHGK
jgi:hypothetical protein